MTVKDIFALRKQGKTEEAYEAIRPLFREHKGKFTTLCMFWTASDVFKLRLEQGRVEEAEKIYRAMLRIQPSVEDDERHSAARFIHYAEGRLIRASDKFRKRYFAIRDSKKREDATVLSGPAVETGSPAATLPAGSPAGTLSTGQQSVLNCIKSKPGLKVPGISEDTGIPAKSTERHIKVLTQRHLIEHRGSKKTGGYHAL